MPSTSELEWDCIWIQQRTDEGQENGFESLQAVHAGVFLLLCVRLCVV